MLAEPLICRVGYFTFPFLWLNCYFDLRLMNYLFFNFVLRQIYGEYDCVIIININDK